MFDTGRVKTRRLEKLWCDSGFKTTFVKHCHRRGVDAEVVKRIHPHQFVVSRSAGSSNERGPSS